MHHQCYTTFIVFRVPAKIDAFDEIVMVKKRVVNNNRYVAFSLRIIIYYANRMQRTCTPNAVRIELFPNSTCALALLVQTFVWWIRNDLVHA